MINKLLWIDWEAKYFGVKLYDEDLIELLVRFAFNLLIAIIVIYYIYYKYHRQRNYTFTLYIFNILIFFISYMMASVKLELGFAFGLFAIFSILRYRTETVPIKEMTYLFAVITIAVINAITTEKVSYLELIITNFVIVIAIYIIEIVWREPKSEPELKRMSIDIPNAHLGNTDRSEELLATLKEKTGIDIVRYEISSVDFIKDLIKIKIFYK